MSLIVALCNVDRVLVSVQCTVTVCTVTFFCQKCAFRGSRYHNDYLFHLSVGAYRARVVMKLSQDYTDPQAAAKALTLIAEKCDFAAKESEEESLSPIQIEYHLSQACGSDYSYSPIPIFRRLQPVSTLRVLVLKDIFWAGMSYVYSIPSFSVVSVKIRHVEVSFCEETNEVRMDAFMREDNDIPNWIPASKC